MVNFIVKYVMKYGAEPWEMKQVQARQRQRMEVLDVMR